MQWTRLLRENLTDHVISEWLVLPTSRTKCSFFYHSLLVVIIRCSPAVLLGLGLNPVCMKLFSSDFISSKQNWILCANIWFECPQRDVFGFISKLKNILPKTCTFSCKLGTWNFFAISIVPLYRLLNILEWLQLNEIFFTAAFH